MLKMTFLASAPAGFCFLWQRARNIEQCQNCEQHILDIKDLEFNIPFDINDML